MRRAAARLSGGKGLAGHLGRTGQCFGKVLYRRIYRRVSRLGVQSVRSVQPLGLLLTPHETRNSILPSNQV